MQGAFGLMLLIFSQIASASQLTVPATVEGTYGLASYVRIPGSSKKDCDARPNGRFDLIDGSCIIKDSVGNTLKIFPTFDGRETVSISVVNGVDDEREYTGVVTSTVGTTLFGETLTVQEANLDDYGTVMSVVKNGCSMTVEVAYKAASVKLGNDKCDSNLVRVSGAKLIKPYGT